MRQTQMNPFVCACLWSTILSKLHKFLVTPRKMGGIMFYQRLVIFLVAILLSNSQIWASYNDFDEDHHHVVLSKMPGRILKIYVENGQQIRKDDVLFKVEAMKMETIVRSEYSGKVIEIFFQEGGYIGTNDAIIQILPTISKQAPSLRCQEILNQLGNKKRATTPTIFPARKEIAEPSRKIPPAAEIAIAEANTAAPSPNPPKKIAPQSPAVYPPFPAQIFPQQKVQALSEAVVLAKPPTVQFRAPSSMTIIPERPYSKYQVWTSSLFWNPSANIRLSSWIDANPISTQASASILYKDLATDAEFEIKKIANYLRLFARELNLYPNLNEEILATLPLLLVFSLLCLAFRETRKQQYLQFSYDGIHETYVAIFLPPTLTQYKNRIRSC